MRGEVTYNGYGFDECIVGRTAAYVDQNDNHIAELTVRETLVSRLMCTTYYGSRSVGSIGSPYAASASCHRLRLGMSRPDMCGLMYADGRLSWVAGFRSKGSRRRLR